MFLRNSIIFLLIFTGSIFQMSFACEIKGQIFFHGYKKKPVVGAIVYVLREEKVIQMTSTNIDGSYRFDFDGTGKYDILASFEGSQSLYRDVPCGKTISIPDLFINLGWPYQETAPSAERARIILGISSLNAFNGRRNNTPPPIEE